MKKSGNNSNLRTINVGCCYIYNIGSENNAEVQIRISVASLPPHTLRYHFSTTYHHTFTIFIQVSTTSRSLLHQSEHQRNGYIFTLVRALTEPANVGPTNFLRLIYEISSYLLTEGHCLFQDEFFISRLK